MRPKDLVYLLVWRPRPRVYGHEVRCVELETDGPVRYAVWNHPKARRFLLTQAMVDEARRYLRPGDAAIDIGAHIGDSTLPLALAAGASGCVLAFEPNRYVYPVLETTARIGRPRWNIVPFMLAVTETDGPIEFEYSDAGFHNGGRHPGISRWRHGHAFRLQVQGRNLERLLENDHPDVADRLRLIKVDAEGYDLVILRTIDALIRRRRPFIRAEVYKWLDAARRREMFAFLSERGYAVHRFGGDARYVAERLTADDMTRRRRFDLFAVPQ